jgi:hypothetical protein
VLNHGASTTLTVTITLDESARGCTMVGYDYWYSRSSDDVTGSTTAALLLNYAAGS